jgi:ubiquinone/menaquinone biosynthesis C-methylase UbiE
MQPHSQQAFTAGQYAPRAQSYVTSAVHAQGDDLAEIAAALRGRPGARVLDLGCGGGHVSYCAAPEVAEVVAVDPTPTMLDAVNATAAQKGLRNITTRLAAAEALPFEDASFDVVLSRFSAHHWANMDAGLREARRVLKAGQWAMFIDVVAPADPALDTHLQAVELLRDASHVRNRSVAEWTAALARAGFALQGFSKRTLRMEFDVWTARTRTPEARAQAIRSLQTVAPDIVRSHFAIGEDGGFDIESATFTVAPVG